MLYVVFSTYPQSYGGSKFRIWSLFVLYDIYIISSRSTLGDSLFQNEFFDVQAGARTAATLVHQIRVKTTNDKSTL